MTGTVRKRGRIALRVLQPSEGLSDKMHQDFKPVSPGDAMSYAARMVWIKGKRDWTMPIINKIDEDNPDNNRTVDTETGVCLKYRDHHGPSSTKMFDVYDGPLIFKIFSEVSGRLDEEKKINHENHRIYLIQIYVGEEYLFTVAGSEFREVTSPLSLPKRKGYADLIRKLLSVHGRYYGLSAKRWGYTDDIKTTFESKILKSLTAWENSNV